MLSCNSVLPRDVVQMSITVVVVALVGIALAPFLGLLLLARFLLGGDEASDALPAQPSPSRLHSGHMWNHLRRWFNERPRRITQARKK